MGFLWVWYFATFIVICCPHANIRLSHYRLVICLVSHIRYGEGESVGICENLIYSIFIAYQLTAITRLYTCSTTGIWLFLLSGTILAVPFVSFTISQPCNDVHALGFIGYCYGIINGTAQRRKNLGDIGCVWSRLLVNNMGTDTFFLL